MKAKESGEDLNVNNEMSGGNFVIGEKVSLNDLMELHRKKIIASKEEQKIEQTKIQKKENLIEARKEELRLLRERQSKELDNLLGGSELLGVKKEEIEKENKVDKLFDEAFGE